MKFARILAAAVPWLAVALAVEAQSPLWIDDLDSLDRPSVERLDEAVAPLLERTFAPDAEVRLLPALAALHDDDERPALEREAVLYHYLQALRELPPGTVDTAIIEWFRSLPPLVVTGHPEGRHRPVPVFDLSTAAAGLANQWAWQAARDAVKIPGARSAEELAAEFDRTPPDSPEGRGMRAALPELGFGRLDAIAGACDAQAGGCGEFRPAIELARGHLEWLTDWLASAPAAKALPTLRQARAQLPREAASELSEAALHHPQPAVAAWALNDLTEHLPKDGAARERWSERLLGLLGEPRLGAAAALQLAKLKPSRWLLESAAEHPDPRVRRRLELVAEMDQTLLSVDPDRVEP